MLFILRLMGSLWLELLLDIQGIIFCQRPGLYVTGQGRQRKFHAPSEMQGMDPQEQESLIN